MKVREVIERLGRVNPDAEFVVIAQNRIQQFTWSSGGADGGTEADCIDFGPYLIDLNDSEKEQ